MSEVRPPLQGAPSGLRVRVPLAGMPSSHHVKNSGQIPLPQWADLELPHAAWVPPDPSFAPDPSRQFELDRLLSALKELPEVDESHPLLEGLESMARLRNQLWVEEVDEMRGLWMDLELVERQATDRALWLQQKREAVRLQSVHDRAKRVT